MVLWLSISLRINLRQFKKASSGSSPQTSAPVEPTGIGAQKPFHPSHQIGLRRFDHQMKMIAHQTVGMHLPIGLGAGFSERFQKSLTVAIVAEDWFAAVAAVHQMINCPRILQA